MSKKITVKQVKSSIGQIKSQKQSLLGLGLRKIGDKKELEDTPSVRGLISKVNHLVNII